jgi:hypothetical protein
VAFDGNDTVTAFERAPTAAFKPVRLQAGIVEPSEPAVALRDDGAAVVAWRVQNPDGETTGGVKAVVRRARGSFSGPMLVASPRHETSEGVFIIGSAEGRVPVPPLDQDNGRLRAALSSDDRVLLTWAGARGAGDGDRPVRALAAVGRLTDGFGRVTTLGSPCRGVNGVAPLVAGGKLAAAWTTNLTRTPFPLFAGFELPSGAGRVHMAVATGRPAPWGKAPVVRLEARAGQRLRFDQGVRVKVSCDRACDLRGLIRGDTGRLRAFDSGALDRAGTTALDVGPGPEATLAPRAVQDVRVVVHACATNAPSLTRATLRVTVRRVPPPPVPVPLGVRARRLGKTITVTWHVPRRADRVTFIVQARSTPRTDIEQARLADVVEGHHRHGFMSRLRLQRGDRVPYVAVTAAGLDPPHTQHTVVVPVRSSP